MSESFWERVAGELKLVGSCRRNRNVLSGDGPAEGKEPAEGKAQQAERTWRGREHGLLWPG